MVLKGLGTRKKGLMLPSSCVTGLNTAVTLSTSLSGLPADVGIKKFRKTLAAALSPALALSTRLRLAGRGGVRVSRRASRGAVVAAVAAATMEEVWPARVGGGKESLSLTWRGASTTGSPLLSRKFLALIWLLRWAEGEERFFG